MQEKTGERDISWQNKDILSKVLGDAFKGKSLAVYGVENSEIVDVKPTNLPAIEVSELRMDHLFEFEDGSLGIVDYESSYTEENKVKYLNYVARLSKRIYNDYGRFIPLRVIIIYTADVRRGSTKPLLELNAVTLRLTEVFLMDFDSEEMWEELEDAVVSDAISDELLMKLIIYPLTHYGSEAKRLAAHRVIDLALQITAQQKKIFALAGIGTAADKNIDDEDAKRIRREIQMTKVGRLIIEDINRDFQERMTRAIDEKAEKDALNLLREGDSVEKVARCVDLPLERVKKLKESVLV